MPNVNNLTPEELGLLTLDQADILNIPQVAAIISGGRPVVNPNTSFTTSFGTRNLDTNFINDDYVILLWRIRSNEADMFVPSVETIQEFEKELTVQVNLSSDDWIDGDVGILQLVIDGSTVFRLFDIKNPPQSFIGTGARTILITVTDGSDPISSATVRISSSGETFVGTTDSLGQIQFNINDGNWTVAITAAGFEFNGAVLEVDDDKSPTYVMNSVTITPSPIPSQVTGFLTCYDEFGQIESGVKISVQLVQFSEDGGAYDTAIWTEISNGDGLVQFPGLWIGAEYRGRREQSGWVNFTVPNDNFALPAILGKP